MRKLGFFEKQAEKDAETPEQKVLRKEQSYYYRNRDKILERKKEIRRQLREQGWFWRLRG